MVKKYFLVVSSTYICGLCLLNSNLKVQILTLCCKLAWPSTQPFYKSFLVGFQVVLIVVTVFMF